MNVTLVLRPSSELEAFAFLKKKTISGHTCICLSHKEKKLKNWCKNYLPDWTGHPICQQAILWLFIFTGTEWLILSNSHRTAWTRSARYPKKQEKLQATFGKGLVLLDLCATVVLSSLAPMDQTNLLFGSFSDAEVSPNRFANFQFNSQACHHHCFSETKTKQKQASKHRKMHS